jgi:hypothetical protein
MSRLAVLAAVWGLGCTAAVAPEPYPPLVCDPTREGELAFGFQTAGAFFPLPGEVANGRPFLFVDGACRYWVDGDEAGEVVTGVLDDALLAEMNADLLTGPWTSVDGEHVSHGFDAATSGVGRDAITASATGIAPPSDALETLLTTSRAWASRLRDAGTPIAGPVRLEMMRWTWSAPPDGTTAWPLATPLETVLGVGHVSATVRDEAETAVLRGLPRTGGFMEGTTVVSYRVVDVVPLADENGCLRPLFPGTCSELSRVP